MVALVSMSMVISAAAKTLKGSGAWGGLGARKILCPYGRPKTFFRSFIMMLLWKVTRDVSIGWIEGGQVRFF